MRDSFISKFGTVFIILLAFIDGMLVASNLIKKIESTAAKKPFLIEDISQNHEEEIDKMNTLEELAFRIKEVPFTTQAPLGDWGEPWNEFSEEAVMAMARLWYLDEQIISLDQIALMMKDIARYELEVFGSSTLSDIYQVQIVLKNFFGMNSEILENPDISRMKEVLEEGSIIIAPINGKILLNPYYGNPAPSNHMVLIYGWKENYFITHDPGTSRGKSYLYEQKNILDSIQDLDAQKRILIVSP